MLPCEVTKPQWVKHTDTRQSLNPESVCLVLVVTHNNNEVNDGMVVEVMDLENGPIDWLL